MSKKAAKKAEIEQSKAAAQRGAGSLIGAIVGSLVVLGVISALVTFIMCGTLDMGNVLSLAAAIVIGMCYQKGQISTKTLVTISAILGIFIGLLMGAVHIGYFFATNEGSLALFEASGLEAVGKASGIAPLDAVRRLLMHLLFNSKYGWILNISLAGMVDVFISLAFYIYFMYFMIKRLSGLKNSK